jgi:ribose transport system ATP-binding protein
MTLTVRENLYMNPAQSLRWKGVFSGPRRERAAAAKLTREVRLRPENPEAVVATLSGGNQQKVVLGRWLNIDLRILVLEEPTMGIDVGARAEIYGLIQRLAVEGLAVIVISSDFEEIATICHRCLVFDRGAVRSELLGHDIQIEALTYLASGGKDRGEQ